MPDQHRQQRKDHMSPRSPSVDHPLALTDHPLALVIGNRDPHHHHHHQPHSPNQHKIISNVGHGHGTSSPGRSSGYSDHMTSPSHSPPHREEEEQVLQPQQGFRPHDVDHEEVVNDMNVEEEEDQEVEAAKQLDNSGMREENDVPLALVVDKSKLIEEGRERLDTIQSGDSGHEDYFSGGSSPIQSRTPPRAHGEESMPTGMLLQRRISNVPADQAGLRRTSLGQADHRIDIQPNVTIAKIMTGDESGDDKNAKEEMAEDLSKSNSAPQSLGIKIKDFARMSCDERQTMDKIMADPEISRASNSNRKLSSSSRSFHVDAVVADISDVASEVSSVDTWTTGSVNSIQLANGVTVSRMSKVFPGTPTDTLYPCEFCDKFYANKYHLQSHLVTHTGERNFPCRKCGKCFGRKSTLRAHMTTHTKTSNFMCPLCEKACNDNNSLEEHIRMHTGEKPFICSICSKAYARKSHLNVHYRVHTGERPFVCSECGKDFTEKRFLNDHMQTAHSGQDGPLKCPNCFREFAYKTSLKQHLKKQMCVKNINRSQGNTTHGTHAKQFQCPFCEKSYSWKQTLKQHVSMYHRNKVHTDEFWKYELAKHRRVGVDNAVNDDMWKKQLGKHAEDLPKDSSSCPPKDMESLVCPVNKSLQDLAKPGSSPQHEDKWLDQIQRSTSQNANQRAQVDKEIKLLALQSLQSSLHFMTMQPTGEDKKQAAEVIERQTAKSYLPMLERGDLTKAPVTPLKPPIPELGQRSPSRSPSRSPMLPDIKEEPAAKRTQMWLAQLGRYRQRSLVQEELDRNHDELWEEQISRNKANPAKPPVEIVIDDDARENDGKEDGIAAITAGAIALPFSPPKKCTGMIPLMSALQVHPPPSTFKPRSAPSATITKPPTDSEEDAIILPKPKYPELGLDKSEGSGENEKIPRYEEKKLTLPLENDIPDLPVSEPETEKKAHNDESRPEQHDPKTCPEEPGSFLKSILLDRFNRKRPSLEIPSAKDIPPKRTFPGMMEESSNDILRRRLLGLKDPLPQVPAVQTESQKTHPPLRHHQLNHQPGPNNHLLVPAPPSANVNILSTRFVPSIPPTMTRPSTLPSLRSSITPVPDKRSPSCHDENGSKDENDKLVETQPKALNGDYKEEHNDQNGTKKEKALSLYAHTSVLKHLLYRYTESASH